MLFRFQPLLLAFILLTNVAHASFLDDIRSATSEVKCFFGADECSSTEAAPAPTTVTPPDEAPSTPAKPTKSDEPDSEPTEAPPSPSSRPRTSAPPTTAPRTSSAEPTSTATRPRVTSEEKPSPTTLSTVLTSAPVVSSATTNPTTATVLPGQVSGTDAADLSNVNEPTTENTGGGPKAGVVAAGVIVGVLVLGALIVGAFFLVRKRNLEREASMNKMREEQKSFGKVEGV